MAETARYRRDMDLVRSLLLVLADKGWLIATEDVFEGLGLPGVDAHQIGYHLEILTDAGLVAAETDSRGYIQSYRLTWQGQEFIDAVQSDTVWRKVKETLEQIGGYTFPVVMEIAQRLLLDHVNTLLKP